MSFARVLTAAAACVVLGAAAAACSGSFGSGTNGPVPLGSLAPNAASSPSAPPTSSTTVLTYGESTAFQNLPEVGGYSGAIAFPTAAPPTPLPKSSAVPSAEPVAIGATLFVKKPEDGPDLNFVSGKGKKVRSRDLPARALAYLRLLPTHDLTLSSYPRIAIDIPRDIASQYRDGEFGLALWNSGTKDSAYRLAVAERDAASSPPPIVRASAPSVTPPPTPSPTPSPTTSASPGALGFPRAPGAPGASSAPIPSAAPTLPPQRILFAGTAAPLKLVANRPAIFALYALPHPTTRPSSVPSAGGSAAPSSALSSSASPAASASPSASASPRAR